MTPRKLGLALALSAALVPAAQAGLKIDELFALTTGNGARDGSAEILAFSPHEDTVLSTMAGTSGYGVQVLTLSNTGALAERGIVTFDTAFGTVADISGFGASSTAVDPLQRGFGVVSLIPTANGTTLGKLGFFDYRTGSVAAIKTLDVGFHPDSVRFSADGSKLYVINEGEFTSGGNTDAPGSISIVDLSGIGNIGDVASLTNAAVKTYDFQAANLGAGVSLAGLRVNDPTATDIYRHIEPEYLSERDGKLYVSLQENNALGVFDLASEKWVAIHSLGTITQTIDASDRDGPGSTAAAQINDSVAGMPMPDTIATYSVGGKTYVVTANEGDFRVDDADRSRISAIPATQIDDATEAALNAIYGGNYRANGALGRLRVSNIDGDTDNDGQIEVLTMVGTRSFSIWDADTGALVKDSGSLEGLLLGLDPLLHNITDGDPASFDARSPDKGPEPEALVLGEVAGNMIAFLGMERQNGLLAFDISNPNSPVFMDYINSLSSGLVSPESLLFVSATDSPTGQALLLAGYELNGGGIGVYSVVPEPGTLALALAGVAGLAGRARRRTLAV
jgi:MYXO-CTERM domain-containing protein